MPIDLKFIEDDIDELSLDDVSDLNIQAMGNVYIKYADSNSPASLEETYDDPITDEQIHAYIGIYIGIQEPIVAEAYNWCVRDLTAIQDTLRSLEETKQDKLNTTQMEAVNSGINETKVNTYDTHITDQNNPHNVTKNQVGLSNVDNKSEAELKADLMTTQNIIDALGYTPGTSNFSGDYNDLSNKPDLSIYAQSSDLSAVATSGDYNDLINKPTVTQSVSVNGSTYTPDANGNVDLGNIGGGGSSYTAGTGIDITDNIISVKPATLHLIGYEEDEE